MFGALRFVLSLMVVAYHLSDSFEIGGIKPFAYIGTLAVYGFFIVSGFLMTLVLNETYRFKGTSFWYNRFLRLYPAYLFTALLTLWALLVWPKAMAAYHPAYVVRLGLIDFAGNLSIWLFPLYKADFRLVPPTWSVGVELIMYLALYLFAARSSRNAWISLAIGAGYFLLATIPALKWERYYSPCAALLPFSLGAVGYFAHKQIPAISQRQVGGGIAAVLGLWLLLLVAAARGGDYMVLFFWSLAVMTALVFLLMRISPNSGRLQVWDKFLGDLAYPVFLLHWIIAFFVLKAFGLSGRGIDLLVISLPFILTGALLLMLLVDRPLQAVRKRVRSDAVRQTPTEK